MKNEKKKVSRSQRGRLEQRPQAVFVPPVGLSETLLAFAKPLLLAFEEPPTDELLERLMLVVVTIWNAHVMALPAWGEPEHLSELKDTVYAEGAPPQLAEAFELLSAQRQQFRADARAVGHFEVAIAEKGFRLTCEPQLPRRSLPDA